MAGLDLEHGLQLLDERLAELRQVDANLAVTWSAVPDLPLAIVALSGVEVLVDPLGLIRRIGAQHDSAAAPHPAQA